MKEWAVTVPIYGTATIFVMAESAEEAREKVMRDEYEDSNIDHWEVSEGCGRFCHRTQFNEVSVEPNE